MIQYGDQTKIPQLKKLWKVCFADEDAYIDDFFTAMYQNEHVLLEEENGVLMGASFFLPGEIWLEQPETAGSWQPVRYVYALAVYPQYRGKGIAARLLQTARRLYDAPLIAEPAEEGLIQGFYEPHGFVKNFYLKKHALRRKGRADGQLAVDARKRSAIPQDPGRTFSKTRIYQLDGAAYRICNPTT